MAHNKSRGTAEQSAERVDRRSVIENYRQAKARRFQEWIKEDTLLAAQTLLCATTQVGRPPRAVRIVPHGALHRGAWACGSFTRFSLLISPRRCSPVKRLYRLFPEMNRRETRPRTM